MANSLESSNPVPVLAEDGAAGNSETLRTDFSRVSAFKPDKTQIDADSLECEIQIGLGLCRRLFARMQQLGCPPASPGKSPSKSPALSVSKSPAKSSASSAKELAMDFTALALAVRAICDFSHDEQIDF
jgi:hypothetical protein